jgi:hypothetical protein
LSQLEAVPKLAGVTLGQCRPRWRSPALLDKHQQRPRPLDVGWRRWLTDKRHCPLQISARPGNVTQMEQGFTPVDERHGVVGRCCQDAVQMGKRPGIVADTQFERPERRLEVQRRRHERRQPLEHRDGFRMTALLGQTVAQIGDKTDFFGRPAGRRRQRQPSLQPVVVLFGEHGRFHLKCPAAAHNATRGKAQLQAGLFQSPEAPQKTGL